MLSYDEIKDLHTPCYVFEEEELRKNFKDFQIALRTNWSEGSNVSYSVKTNPLPWILKIARDCGCMAEVVSDEEYHLALSCGFTPDQIIFNGPIKGKAWLEYAYKMGSLVNIDSASDLETTLMFAAANPRRVVNVGVRANIDLETFCPSETTTGSKGGRFGYSYEGGSLAEVIATLKACPNVVIAGLHMHVTTYSRSQKVYRVLADHATKIVEEFQLSELRYIDIGGGFYGGGKKNEGAYAEYARTIATSLGRVCDPTKVDLFVEPGGAVICTPGYYIGRVLDVKDTPYNRFVVSDFSRVNIDHEMKKESYPMVLFAQKQEIMNEQVLCGFTCMESDRLCVLKDKPELSRGDMLMILYAGAYSMSFTPGFFIRYAPAVYVKNARGVYLERAPFNETPPEC